MWFCWFCHALAHIIIKNLYTLHFLASTFSMPFIKIINVCSEVKLRHDKTSKMTAPSEDTDQPGHPPSLIRVFAVHMKKAWVLSYPLSAQRRLWSDWADAQTDLSLRWAHSHLVGFVMSQLIYCNKHWSFAVFLKYLKRNFFRQNYRNYLYVTYCLNRLLVSSCS